MDPETAPSIRNRLINGVFPRIEILPLGKFIGGELRLSEHMEARSKQLWDTPRHTGPIK